MCTLLAFAISLARSSRIPRPPKNQKPLSENGFLAPCHGNLEDFFDETVISEELLKGIVARGLETRTPAVFVMQTSHEMAAETLYHTQVNLRRHEIPTDVLVDASPVVGLIDAGHADFQRVSDAIVVPIYPRICDQ